MAKKGLDELIEDFGTDAAAEYINMKNNDNYSKGSKVFMFNRLYDPFDWNEYKKEIKEECYKYLWNEIFGEYTEVFYAKPKPPCYDKVRIATIDDAANIFNSETFCFKFRVPSKCILISITEKIESKSRSEKLWNSNLINYKETVSIVIEKMVDDQDEK